ncbi:alpha/beta fold hydrolase [Flavobacterium sp. xlx-214]|uniref:alpha/beta hydrolase n=1 Tax=unclassified Flavobacterium TaxID=196869 RepID=UPI0013D13C31|nr:MULTISPECIES: alpha/beta fold hydrolase [unclassified Flavobacterium]MBA5791633.1 alpha/beta fold hydrolase [Flavobacterium sp. xlx-221]QMI82878.1 alpha/beta fold hydrolase [Flavobacterium sp. xlx-214]
MQQGILNYIIKEPKVILDKNPLLLLIHGYGSNEEDLFSFATELPDHYYVISVQAPYQVPPYGFAWYAITFDADMNKFSDDSQAIESRDTLVQFIDEVCAKYPIDKENVNLVGFSQGAILSYSVALTYPEKVNKVVALSGYFNPAILNPKTDLSAYKNIKIFGSHGTVDQVIPVEWARKTSEFLKPYNISFEYNEYPVGHGVAPKNFFDFKEFLLK